jgi:uncharacterized protein YjbI with pentapeptide repeats
MKLLPLAALGLMLTAAPAMAQNAGQIAHARAGASCPGCNLFQADFGGQEMKGRNFARARLRQADLSTSIMNRTIFAGGDLRDVNGYAGVFTGASFAGANLTNASFVGAYLQGANFRGATLSGANFSGAEMNGAIGLTQGQLSQACGDRSTILPRGLSLRACR